MFVCRILCRLTLAFLPKHCNKFLFMCLCYSKNTLQIFENNFFDRMQRYVVRRALTMLFLAIRGTIKTVFFLAAVPVEIHFITAIGTIQKSRKHAHLTIDRQPALYTFSQFLDSIKRIFIDYRLMRILKHDPVLFRKKDHRMALIRLLLCTEVYRMPQIYGIRKYASDRRYRPYFRVIYLFKFIFPPHFMFPDYRRNSTRFIELSCYLGRPVPLHTHRIDTPNYPCRFFFDMPVAASVFRITVWRTVCKTFAGLSLCP